METVKQQFPELTDTQAQNVYAEKVVEVLREKKAAQVRGEYNPRSNGWHKPVTGRALPS